MDLLEAKKQHDNLHQVSFADNTIVIFRLLSWKEYEYYRNLYDQGLVNTSDETLFYDCLVEIQGNKDFNELRAGVIHTITNVILSLSGPKNMEDWETALDNARKNIAPTLFSQIEMVICSAFPAYKPEDIWSMGWSMIIKRLAQAESILLQSNRISKPLKFQTDSQRKNELAKNLVKDARHMRRVDQSIPVGRQHPIGRDSNWKKVRD